MEQFSIKVLEPSEELVPLGHGTPPPLLAPLEVLATVQYSAATSLDAQVRVRFDGEKYVLKQLCLSARTGEIATSSLLVLTLPAVIGAIAKDSIQGAKELRDQISRGWNEKGAPPQLLANIYALEFASLGKPTDTISKFMNWSRNNTTTHLRKIAAKYPLPGRTKPNKNVGGLR